MTEYINIDAAIEAVAYRLAINKDDYERAERQAVDWLQEAEEDVVKVVRCKDCKHYVLHTLFSHAQGWCERLCDEFDRSLAHGTEVDDFCSYGERAEE